MEHLKEELFNLAKSVGFWEAGFLNMEQLRYYPEVRSICEQNTCRNYGKTWACPPAVGTLHDCQCRIEQYNTMLLFSGKYDLEDSFDFEGMTAGLHAVKKPVDVFAEKIDERLTDYLLLSNEGCGRCETCTYPSSPCRYPSRLYHSIEGYGFVVSELAKHAGIRYINGADTVTYFGALLFRQ